MCERVNLSVIFTVFVLVRFSTGSCCIHLQYLLFVQLSSDIQYSIVDYDCVGDPLRNLFYNRQFRFYTKLCYYSSFVGFSINLIKNNWLLLCFLSHCIHV